MGEVVALPLQEPAPEERPVLVVDFGGQYSQLIARRVRECRVYSELVGHSISPEEVRARNPLALVLSGGPASVYADGAPELDPEMLAVANRYQAVTWVPVRVRCPSIDRGSTAS